MLWMENTQEKDDEKEVSSFQVWPGHYIIETYGTVVDYPAEKIRLE